MSQSAGSSLSSGLARTDQVDPFRPLAVPHDQAALYKEFGRDTAAGRAMFNLYNKGKVNYAPNVRIKTKQVDPNAEHQAKIRARKQEVERKKAYNPDVYIPEPEFSSRRLLPARPSRKPAAVIAMENAAAFAPPAHSAVYVESRESQIERLQSKFSGEAERKKGGKMMPPLKAKAKTNSHQQLFESIAQEVEERQAFLEHMRSMGQAEQYETQIKNEIAERVKEMNLLNAMMSEEDGLSTQSGSSKTAAATASRAKPSAASLSSSARSSSSSSSSSSLPSSSSSSKPGSSSGARGSNGSTGSSQDFNIITGSRIQSRR